MANPLSVAGSAVNVVSLGFQVTRGITEYIDALNSRDQEIASVRQKNDTLRKTLRVVETSLSRLQQEHQAAAEVVRECLDSSMKELKALESLIAELVVCDPSLSRRQSKLKSHGKKLMYPFNRPKLEQLGTRLGCINTALQLALQTLGLSISQLGAEKLVTLEATSHAISTDLLTVQAEVSAIGTPLQDINTMISGFETRFDALENLFGELLAQSPASNKAGPEITSTVVTSRLLGKPGVLKDVCDAAGARGQGLSALNHGTAQIGSTMLTYIGGSFSCFCSHIRQLQREKTVWGSLSLSVETVTEKHLPGCPAAQVITETNRSRKVSLTYTGLRHLLNSAIQFSFMIPSGAGGWSLNSSITYIPTVDWETAPAFKILDLLNYSQRRGSLDEVIWLEKFIPSAVSSILRLFHTKKASPRAVDGKNRSLVYHLTNLLQHFTRRFRRLPNQLGSNSLLSLFEYLLLSNAPATDYDLYGETPLSSMFSSCAYSAINEPLSAAVVDLLLRSNTEGNVVCLSKPPPASFSRIMDITGKRVDVEGTAVLFQFLASSPRIAEAYGCGPLSLAILSQNLKQVEHLARNHPATLAERNLFGHSPLHLAADKPSCLRLLVKFADTKALVQMDTPRNLEISALETAVSLSRLNCRERLDRLRMCRRCRCAESAVILMKAGCALPVSAELQQVLDLASKRCKLRYVRYMKDRRKELKQLALDKLSVAEVQQLGLASERVLDSLALRVVQLLQDRGIQIPESLAVARNEPLSVYQGLEFARDADLFFQAGFHDTDSWCNADREELYGHYRQMKDLPYLFWLVGHGALSPPNRPSSSSESIIRTHYILWKTGSSMFHHFRESWNVLSESSPFPSVSRKAWFQLSTTLLASNVVDTCHCSCSSGGCTTLTCLLRGAFDSGAWKRDKMNTDQKKHLLKMTAEFVLYLGLFWNLNVTHYTEALRYLTHDALGIRHSSCCTTYQDNIFGDGIDDEQLEQGYELELLEELLREFEAGLVGMPQDPDQKHLNSFWKRTWVDRMFETLDRLEGSDLTDDEKRAAEEIGVVWDIDRPEVAGPPKPLDPPKPFNPYQITTLDYWMYELLKIETEI